MKALVCIYVYINLRALRPHPASDNEQELRGALVTQTVTCVIEKLENAGRFVPLLLSGAKI